MDEVNQQQRRSDLLCLVSGVSGLLLEQLFQVLKLIMSSNFIAL